jgi:hypothetical protein
MRRGIILLGVLSIGVFAGCGGTDTGTSPDLAPIYYKLVSGDYTVIALRNKMDGCMIDTDPMNPVMGSKITLTNDGMGNVTLKGYGKGVVSNNMGTLTLTGTQMGGTCTFNYSSTVVMTLTGDNQFTGNYSESDTMHTATCTPVNTDCMSSWTFDAKL